MQTVTIGVRLSRKEKDSLMNQAKAEGTDLSAYVRRGLCLLNKERQMQAKIAKKALDAGMTYPPNI